MLLLGDISVYEKLYNHRIEMKNLLSVKSDCIPKDDDITVYAGERLENCKFTSRGLKVTKNKLKK